MGPKAAPPNSATDRNGPYPCAVVTNNNVPSLAVHRCIFLFSLALRVVRWGFSAPAGDAAIANIAGRTKLLLHRTIYARKHLLATLPLAFCSCFILPARCFGVVDC